MTRVDRIHLLHTNDLHSHLDQTSKMAPLIEELRAQWQARNERSLLLDIGDHMDRVRMETEGTDGRVNGTILERMGYDFVTLGNNELLTFSQDQLAAVYRDAPYQVLSSNVYDVKRMGQPAWIRPCSHVTLGSVRIGMLAATIPYQTVYELMGWDVRDPVSTLAEHVRRLRGEVDLIVVLSHLGLMNDRLLAKEVPGIDLIIGAHTHHLLEELERVGDTWLAGAGKHGQHLGHIEIEVDPDAGRVRTIKGRVYPLARRAEEREMQELIAHYRGEALENMAQPIHQLSRPLGVDWYGESPLPNLLADALCDWVGAEAALVNNGQLLAEIPAGSVTRQQLHAVCPHPINPVLMMIEGKEIRRTLEEALLDEFMTLPIRGFGFRGEVLGTVSVSGMEVFYDPEAPPFQRIKEIRINGSRLEEEQLVSLATIDMFTFGIGYMGLKEGKVQKYYLPEFLRDLLAKQLQTPAALARCEVKRWHRI
ncbi:bifunctional metallophosphatase/5'-nucleotidase [Laceyella sacchari]|uniref:5'-nucleotidase C-terminal domain-containing protein n=1 Tax=Laceyella sacchari TaxID=37482 RepID=A0ABY5U364_LACSH|nr:5'-nucleotidase C-terminal domain-containing protein [Laceyella sacchari]UWE04076.1 5'-nucleotidase C-terminal domain-containing protein [Laceyella sacchari]